MEIYVSRDRWGLIMVIGCPFVSLSTLGKVNSTGREEVVVIAVSVGQVGDAGTRTDSRFHNSFWEIACK